MILKQVGQDDKLKIRNQTLVLVVGYFHSSKLFEFEESFRATNRNFLNQDLHRFRLH